MEASSSGLEEMSPGTMVIFRDLKRDMVAAWAGDGEEIVAGRRSTDMDVAWPWASWEREVTIAAPNSPAPKTRIFVVILF